MANTIGGGYATWRADERDKAYAIWKHDGEHDWRGLCDVACGRKGQSVRHMEARWRTRLEGAMRRGVRTKGTKRTPYGSTMANTIGGGYATWRADERDKAYAIWK